MSKSQIITGLDIGSDTIKILSARENPKTEELEVVFFERMDSFGVQKGRVGNPKEVAEKVSQILDKFPKSSSRIEQVFVNVNGSKIQLVPNRGLISVSPANQKVCQEDIDRILEETQNISLPSNREVFDIFPKTWILDGEAELKKPLGLQGVRLELEAFLLSIFALDIENIIEAVGEAGLEVESVLPSPLAASNAVLDRRQKELGVAVLDIGACTSGLTVYEEGNLMDLAVFPVGSANITNDIAIGLKTEIDIAERIKREFSSCAETKKTGKRKIEIGAKAISVNIKGSRSNLQAKEEIKKDYLNFSQKQVKKIIEARVDEIFELAQKELKKIGRQELLPAGIVLTGGGVKLPGIVDVSKKVLKLPSRIGYARGFVGLEKDCSLATVCGLIIESKKGDFPKNHFFSGVKSHGIWRKVKNILKPFVP
ncbi:MAG: cell division protein FtsA [Candidatus Paceibacterota bacterium]|jgi:cell division protein FtsA|nr:cell division protein FtsA [Candidatus Paceibacterota bacterium]MDD4830955.1 cell division protein FtsA [Candidatus Paceibacterota bacterium]MDD4875378.1 cell division protein FtsA [Candidatus Paceibacterota bacterium]